MPPAIPVAWSMLSNRLRARKKDGAAAVSDGYALPLLPGCSNLGAAATPEEVGRRETMADQQIIALPRYVAAAAGAHSRLDHWGGGHA